MELDQRSSGPHVLIFPLPLQSHVITTLEFGELLCLANFHITFLNSHFVHNRLLRHTNIQSHFARYPRFRFDTITDSLPDDHPRLGARYMLEMFDSRNGAFCSIGLGLLACVVVDGIMNFATDIAKEIGLMSISFRTTSASCYWSYFCIPKLIEASELPFKAHTITVSRVPWKTPLIPSRAYMTTTKNSSGRM
ncbi:unnamed protein product [Prunus armeniaca]|uniref:Uncharacterized protein n=1 Tax=Prunus armeniaca TaxID=36596 RepID=A0A6J5U9C0_PRUAR|nr:unnamed protein product [Prunus armeniaca]CAB4301298.1 unnamed protein product [Prunus armeniaca]